MTRQLLAIALLVIASCNQLFGHKIDAMEFEFQATKEAWVLKGAIDVSYLLPEFRNDDDEPPLRRYPLMNETSPDQWKVYLSEMEATLNRLLTFKFNGQTIPHTFHYPGFSIEKPVLPEDLDDIAFIHIEIKAAPVAGEGELRIHWNDDLEAELIVVVDPDNDVLPLSALTGESIPLLTQDATGHTENPDVSPLWSWLLSGFQHVIPKGLDHILFIIGIFLAAPRLSPILGQSLLFTLAQLHGSLNRRPLTPPWWGGQVAGFATLFCMGSGAVSSVAVLIVLGYKALALRQRERAEPRHQPIIAFSVPEGRMTASVLPASV